MKSKTKFRVEATFALISEPFVDWFTAGSEIEARALWYAQAAQYGLPVAGLVALNVEAL